MSLMRIADWVINLERITSIQEFFRFDQVTRSWVREGVKVHLSCHQVIEFQGAAADAFISMITPQIAPELSYIPVRTGPASR